MSHLDASTPESHETQSHETGTTHAAPGAGNPELIVSVPDHPELSPVPDHFPLDQREVTIGSGPDQDIRLEGIDAHHLTIFHDERDEYRVRASGPVGGGSAAEPAERALRTGATIEAGQWVLTFHREEFADHGRPFGGRQGGEGSDNRLQPPRPADREDAATADPVPGEEQQNDQRPAPDRQQ